ncbi:ejaculatory bulb-specific protein 3-like [Leptopilina boulardi]|uniref:ejaculatory bulb-specific protein 3-like n=1 Tax=Leptopilina boulardi TaxID=63433 RepID=UPI0021F56908|nr:ejaculatory bulb-specific protein 3-like [Leptopilina boulardi]
MLITGSKLDRQESGGSSTIKSERNVLFAFILFKSKMNVRLFMFALILCLIFFVRPPGAFGYLWPKQNTYMTRWDKVNIDEILNNKRLLHHYFNCLMSKGPCPPDGMELKRSLPEALATGCAKCTKSQIEGAVKIIRHLREFEADKFEILANKYDPQGIYRQKYFEPPPDDNNAA